MLLCGSLLARGEHLGTYCPKSTKRVYLHTTAGTSSPLANDASQSNKHQSSGYGTHVPKAVSSKPSTIYWMDIFHIPICCKICNVCLKRQKLMKKRMGLAHLKQTKLGLNSSRPHRLVDSVERCHRQILEQHSYLCYNEIKQSDWLLQVM